MKQEVTSDLRFEKLTKGIIDDLMCIELEAYPDPWTRGMFVEESKGKRSHFYVMYLGSELIGYGGFWLVLDEAHITSVTVCASQRGKGLGRDLMHFLLAKAGEAGARMATLEVRASNDTARNLYLSLGFRAVGLRKQYYPKSREDAVVMLKELDRLDEEA